MDLLPVRPGRRRHRLRLHRRRSLRDTLKAQYGWNITWYLIFVVLVVVVTAFTLFGDRAVGEGRCSCSAGSRSLVFVALAISGLARRVRAASTLDSFNPGNIPNGNGIYLGVVFTILALSGFESVAPLGEETENPKRNLPIAIIGSMILIAIFYMFVNWGVLVGHGTTSVRRATSPRPTRSSTSPDGSGAVPGCLS